MALLKHLLTEIRSARGLFSDSVSYHRCGIGRWEIVTPQHCCERSGQSFPSIVFGRGLESDNLANKADSVRLGRKINIYLSLNLAEL